MGNPPKGRLAPDHPLTLNISSSPIDFHYILGSDCENDYFDEVFTQYVLAPITLETGAL